MKHGLHLYTIYTVKQNSNLQIPNVTKMVKILKKNNLRDNLNQNKIKDAKTNLYKISFDFLYYLWELDMVEQPCKKENKTKMQTLT